MPIRTVLFALASVSAVAPLSATVAAHDMNTPSPVVRALHPRLLAALECGQRRSPTLRGLMSELQEFEAIVYLVRAAHMPRGIEAALLHWVGGDRRRVLRINVSVWLAGDSLIAVIGHELRHAIEALEDPSVVDGDTMRARFDRIDLSQSRVHDSRRPLETSAAIEAGRQIAVELATGSVVAGSDAARGGRSGVARPRCPTR